MVNRIRKQVSRSIGNSRPVEIVIKAQDQASRTFIQIKNDMNVLGTVVDKVRSSVVMLGNAISNVSASTVDSIAEVYRQAVNLKNFLSNDFAVAGISMIAGQLESLTKDSMNFGSTFSSVMKLAVGPGNAKKIGSTFGQIMGEQAFSSFAGSVNLIDQKIMQLWGTVNSIGSKITPGADILLGVSKGLIGISEPVSIFRGMQEGVRKFSGGLVNTIQEIGQLEMGLSALQQVANFGPFNALVRQNIEFREQLVSTQSSLAATNDVILGGTTLTNTANAIKALEGPVRASIQKMRQDSLELVGVTSKDLVGVYNILASQVSSIGGGLSDASNLTIDFAAALGTLGIPLHQAGQEITSILRGQVDQNSALAKSIGLTNQQLNSWKSQGVLIERVRERLEAFAEGNKMAARSVGGISSNIQEVFDNILMRAGNPLLDPLIDKLSAFYEVLNKNALDIQFFVSDLVAALIEIGEAISRMAAKVSGPLVGMMREMIMIIVNSAVTAVRVFEEVFDAVLPAIEPIISFITFMAKNGKAVTEPIFKLFLAAGAIKGAVATLGPVINTVAQLLPGLGEAMMVIDVRGNSLVNQFANLTQSIGAFKAGGLLAMKNVERIPGALDNIANAMGPLGGFAPMIAPIIPMVGTAGIALVGLTKQFPMLKGGIQGVLTAVPGLIDGLAQTAESSNFLNGALKGFAPMMKQAGEESVKYADANKLAAMANEKLTKIAKDTAAGMAKQVVQMGLYSGAVFALFFAFDNLILKNEGMMALLGEIGEQLSDLGNMIMDFLRNPVVSAIIALGALATLIATGVIPNMIKMGITSVNAFKAEAVKNLGDFKKILTGLGDTVVQMIAKYAGLTVATEASTGADVKKNVVTRIVEAQKQKLIALYNQERMMVDIETLSKQINSTATTKNAAATGFLAKVKADFSASLSHHSMMMKLNAISKDVDTAATNKNAAATGFLARMKAQFNASMAASQSAALIGATTQNAEAAAAGKNAIATAIMGRSKAMTIGVTGLLNKAIAQATVTQESLNASRVRFIALAQNYDMAMRFNAAVTEMDTAAKQKNSIATILAGKAKVWMAATADLAAVAIGRMAAAAVIAKNQVWGLMGRLNAKFIMPVISAITTWASATLRLAVTKATLGKSMILFNLQALRAKIAGLGFVGAIQAMIASAFTATGSFISLNAALIRTTLAAKAEAFVGWLLGLKAIVFGSVQAQFATIKLSLALNKAFLMQKANAIWTWIRGLDLIALKSYVAAAGTMLFSSSMKMASIAANFQAIMKWAFAAEFATSRAAAWGVANKLLIGGLKGAALAAKGLITALGPMALAVVAIAAAAEAVRVLHQEFFAGNKILKEYLENLEDAKTKMENTRYQGRGGQEEAPETYWQNRLDIAQGNRGNFVTQGFRWAQEGATVADMARISLGDGDKGYAPSSREERERAMALVQGIEEKGMTTLEGALQALADDEAGLIQLTEDEKKFAVEFVDSLDRHLDRVTADTGEALTETDELIKGREARSRELKGLMDELVQDYNAGEITDEQFEAERTEINEEMTNSIEYMTQMRDRLLALENPTQAQRQQMELLKKAIDDTTVAYAEIDSAAIAQKDVARTGSQYDQLARRATTAEAFITDGKGDPAEYANQAKDLIESTNQMLEAGMISEEEALRRLNLVATNTRLDGAIIAQAQESMTKAVEGQSQRRVATLQSEQASIQAQMRQGTLTQVEGAEKLKTLTEQEGQERLNALETQYENSNRARQQEEQDSLAEQEANLARLRESLAEAGPDTVTGKQIAEEIAAAEAAIANTRKSYADQALVAEQNYNNERVKIANETAENMISAEERIHEAKVRQLEQAQQLAQDTAKKAQLDTDILNQQLLNSGSITKEELAARTAESNQESIRAELEAEKAKLAELEKLPRLTDPEKERERQAQIRAARLRTQELTLQILQSERQEIETNIQLLEIDLRNAARDYGNELEGQIQSLERQNKISEQLTRAYENRVKLAESEKNLRDAIDSYVSSEFELLAETTNSEYRKKQIAQATAAIKLESAKMAAEFARKSLEMEYEQNKLVRERELMENNIAILKAEQAVAQGNVDVQVAQEKFNVGLITKSELDAVILQQQGNMMNLEFTQQERGLILEQQANDERIFAMRAQQVDMEGRSSVRQAEIGLANALPPGLQQRVLNQIGDNIAQDFGYDSRSDMVNAGMAMARQMAQDEFGVGQSVGALSAFDSSLEGLRETLSPQEYAAAVADSQRQFNRQMGPSAFSMQQDQLLGRGAEAFQMPSGSSMGQRDLSAAPPSPQFTDSLGMGIASAINRDVAALPSSATAGMGARDTDRMIAALEGGGRGEIQFNPVFQIEVNASSEEAGSAIAEQVHRELERVIEKSRELLRAA